MYCLAGEIPWEMGNLRKMEIFVAKGMSLSGRIPPSIFNISSLKQINLHDNFLSGISLSINVYLNNLYIRNSEVSQWRKNKQTNKDLEVFIILI